ncbi:hypothetical protein QUF58_13095 [Anaerolineales bacterium HSG24]|nr:hypothetical protein [Anaerolineales bacterium HSG24]
MVVKLGLWVGSAIVNYGTNPAMVFVSANTYEEKNTPRRRLTSVLQGAKVSLAHLAQTKTNAT